MALSANIEKRKRQLANLNPAKKGEPSRNPSGRPKKLPITEALQKIFDDPEFARQYAIAAAKHAKNGSGTHFKEINDRVDGPTKQIHEHTGEDGEPIAINVRIVKAHDKDGGH